MESGTTVGAVGPADGAEPTGAGTWADVVDAALVQRLHRRARQPGLARLGQARALVRRHARMVPGVPLANALTRRVAERTAGHPEVPVVTGRPVAAPGDATPDGGEPFPVVRTAVPATVVAASAPDPSGPAVPGPAVVPGSAVVPGPVVPGPAGSGPAASTPAVPVRDRPHQVAAAVTAEPARTVAARDLPTLAGSARGPRTPSEPAPTTAAGPPTAAAPAPAARPLPLTRPARVLPTTPGPLPAEPLVSSPAPPAGGDRANRPDEGRLPVIPSGPVHRQGRSAIVPPTPSLSLQSALPRPVGSRLGAALPLAAGQPAAHPVSGPVAAPPVARGGAPDVVLARPVAQAADATDLQAVVTARRSRPHGVAREPGLAPPLVHPVPSGPHDDTPASTGTGGASVVDRRVVRPIARGPGLAEQVHTLVVRELAAASAPAPAAPPLPLRAAPPPAAAEPRSARRPAAPVVRADRPAERPPRTPPPVDVGRVAEAVSRRLARRGAVEAERRGMGR